jgi:hypothetical protein
MWIRSDESLFKSVAIIDSLPARYDLVAVFSALTDGLLVAIRSAAYPNLVKSRNGKLRIESPERAG